MENIIYPIIIVVGALFLATTVMLSSLKNKMDNLHKKADKIQSEIDNLVNKL